MLGRTRCPEKIYRARTMPLPILIERWGAMARSRLVAILMCSCFMLFGGIFLFAQDEQGSGPAPNQGAQLFATNCAYCHGADGKGGRGPAIATMPKVIALSDQELIGIVHKGEADQGMPGFPDLGDEGTKAVVQYLRTLQGVTGTAPSARIAGDPNDGRELFFGKGQCSSCHMIRGQGGFMAPELNAYGKNHTAEETKQAIVNPDADLGPTSRVAEVRTKTGESLTGVVRAQDNMDITLQTEDGRYHFLSRASLATVNYTDHSLMPHDYGTRLTSRELDDLVAFLIVTGRDATTEPTPAKRRSHHRD
jgi:cytochrome c oxidase cbb3-type subunit III